MQSKDPLVSPTVKMQQKTCHRNKAWKTTLPTPNMIVLTVI